MAYQAVKHGHMHILKYIKKFMGNHFLQQGKDRATAAKNMKVLKWALRRSSKKGEDICKNCVKQGSLVMLKYALENGASWNIQSCGKAVIKKGSVEMLEYMMEKGWKWNKGDLWKLPSEESIRWATRYASKQCTELCTAAACIGNLLLLKWLREQGYNVCISALLLHC